MEENNGLTFEDGYQLGWQIALDLAEEKYRDQVPAELIDDINEHFCQVTDKYHRERLNLMYDRFNLKIK